MEEKLSRLISYLDVSEILSLKTGNRKKNTSGKEEVTRVAEAYRSLTENTPVSYEITLSDNTTIPSGTILADLLNPDVSKDDIKNILGEKIQSLCYSQFKDVIHEIVLSNYDERDIEEAQSTAWLIAVDRFHMFNKGNTSYEFGTWFKYCVRKAFTEMDVRKHNLPSARSRQYLINIKEALSYIMSTNPGISEEQISHEEVLAVIEANYKGKRGPYDYIPKSLEKIAELREKLHAECVLTLDNHEQNDFGNSDHSSDCYNLPTMHSIEQQVIDNARDNYDPQKCVEDCAQDGEMLLQKNFRDFFNKEMNLLQQFLFHRTYGDDSEVASLSPNQKERQRNRLEDLVDNQDFINACILSDPKYAEKIKLVDGVRTLPLKWIRDQYDRTVQKTKKVFNKFFAQEVLACDIDEVDTVENQRMLEESFIKFGNPLSVIPSLAKEFDEKMIAMRTAI